MPKGKSGKYVDCASATMSFPCGYTYIGERKARAITIRLHKKKCPGCINDANTTIDSMVEYYLDDVLPSGLGRKEIDNKLNTKFLTNDNSPKFDILNKKIESV